MNPLRHVPTAMAIAAIAASFPREKKRKVRRNKFVHPINRAGRDPHITDNMTPEQRKRWNVFQADQDRDIVKLLWQAAGQEPPADIM